MKVLSQISISIRKHHSKYSCYRHLLLAFGAFFTVLLTIGTALPTGTAHAASRAESGKVCVFFAPSGASKLGHVGWGFRDESVPDHWFYGSTENSTSQLYIGQDPDQNHKDLKNFAWSKNGTEINMLNDFIGPLYIQHRTTGELYQSKNFYSQYRCKQTQASDVQDAIQTALDMPNRGYILVGDNCQTAVMQVLTAYDSTTFDSASPDQDSQDSIIPVTWFNLLNVDGFGPITTLASTALTDKQ